MCVEADDGTASGGVFLWPLEDAAGLLRVGFAAEDAHVLWFPSLALVELLVRRLLLKLAPFLAKSVVDNVCCRQDCIWPQLVGHVCVTRKRCCDISQRPVHSLGDAVLRRRARYCGLWADAVFSKLGFKLVADVFAAVVCPQGANGFALTVSVTNEAVELDVRIFLLAQ